MIKATAIAGWEVDLPQLSALRSPSCTEDHANHHGLKHGIDRAFIGR
jgi:hypothetical protein